MIGTDFIFLLIASVSLLMWFRFSEGGIGKLFRGVFFISFIALIASVFLQYKSFPGMNWLMASGNAFLLAIVSLLLRATRSMKAPLIVSFVLLLAVLMGGRAMINNVKSLAYSQTAYAQDGEIIVKLKEGSSELSDSRSDIKLRPLISNDDRPQDQWDQYYILDVAEQNLNALAELAESLRQDAHVEFVEMNEVMKISPELDQITRQTPSKTFADDPAIEHQWHFDIMQYDNLHRYLNTYKKKRHQTQLAILDSGVDSKHEDIRSAYYSIDSKYDQDDNGHGTHCASVAGAVTNNGVGIASLNESSEFVQVSGVKVMNVFGFGTQEKILAGIVKAVDAGAEVISMSLGGRSSDSKQIAYQEAFDYAKSKNVIVVVAAGNNGGSSNDITPANVNGVICVSAVGEDLRMPPFANNISNIKMGILAPGVSIHAAMPQNKYASMSGTSMSTPIVSGLAAIAKSVDPTITAEELHSIMMTTGLDISGGTLVQPYNVIKYIGDKRLGSLN